jgi:hypothetical protein
MKDAAASILCDWLALVVVAGAKRLPQTDPAGFRKLFEEFYAKLTALSPSDIEAVRRIVPAVAAWSEKVEQTRIGGASGDPRLRRAPDGLDWLLRPWVEGRCLYESLLDGTLGLEDIALMNDTLDVYEHNKRIAEGDAPPPRETPDLAAALDEYIAEERVHGGGGSQNGFSEWIRIRKSTYPPLQVFGRDELRAAFKTRNPRRKGRPPKK